jgi:hypothetical protein
MHYNCMIFGHIWKTYGMRLARIMLSRIYFTSLKLKLGACMNASLSDFRLPTTIKTK